MFCNVGLLNLSFFVHSVQMCLLRRHVSVHLDNLHNWFLCSDMNKTANYTTGGIYHNNIIIIKYTYQQSVTDHKISSPGKCTCFLHGIKTSCSQVYPQTLGKCVHFDVVAPLKKNMSKGLLGTTYTMLQQFNSEY